MFPGTLRLLSLLLPSEFPFHPHWKVSESHPMYWELFPTIDHVEPVVMGGLDEDSNWVTTSMLRNSAKAHWSLADLGWTLKPAGDVSEWDGLSAWFYGYVSAHPQCLSDAYLRSWHRAGEAFARVPSRRH